MNPMVAGLNGNKMSSSDESMYIQQGLGVSYANDLPPDSKIELLDPSDAVARTIKKAECDPEQVEGNGVLARGEYGLLPGSGLRTGTREFKVERRDAEPLVYTDIKKVEEDYRNDVVCLFKSLVITMIAANTPSLVDTPNFEACGNCGTQRDYGSY